MTESFPGRTVAARDSESKPAGSMVAFLRKRRRRQGKRELSRTDTRRAQRGRSLERLESRRLLAFSTGVLEDINLLGLSSDPDSLREVAGDLFFLADDGATGLELYRTDGATGETSQVIDLFPGEQGSNIEQLTVVDNDLFFVASDDDGDRDLWTSDGTEAGTIKLIDASETDVYSIYDLTASGSKLFFTAYEDSTGYEIWSSNGTVAGTMVVSDLTDPEAFGLAPKYLTDVDGTLFFTAYEDGYESANMELFKTNGTTAGTMLVADLNGDSYDGSYPRNLVGVGDLLYFTADAGDGFELFVSDGTVGGTVQIADLNPGTDSSSPRDFIAFGGSTIFTADDGTGRRLFSTDGTTVTPAIGSATDDLGLDPSELTVLGSKLFFVADGGSVAGTAIAAMPELTAANTHRVSNNQVAGISEFVTGGDNGRARLADANGQSYNLTSIGTTDDGPGFVSGGSVGQAGVNLTSVEVGDLIVTGTSFNANGSSEISDATYSWTIEDVAGLSNISFDGFASGNEFDSSDEGLVFELFLNDSLTPESVLVVSGDDLDNFFAGRDAGNISLAGDGTGLITKAVVRMSFGFSTPGTDGGPDVVTINNKTPDGTSESVVVRAALTADGAGTSPAGVELVAYDGTSLSLVADLVPNASSRPANLTAVGNQLYFTANNPLDGTGRELYVSDGTEAGTTMVVDIRPGSDLASVPLGSDPSELVAVGGSVYFTATDVNGDTELWTSTGSSAGTSLVANLNDSTESSDPEQFTVVGSLVYFVANNGVDGESIYVADPAAGTIDWVEDVSPSAFDEIIGLTALPNGQLLFGHALGVFSYDPDTSTRHSLSGLPPSVDENGKAFELLEDHAYYASGTPVTGAGSQGIELWRTDGSAGGTAVVADVYPGPPSSGPRNLTAHNGEIYFSAESLVDTGFTGRELWRTDGGVGAVPILNDSSDIANGSGDANPEHLTSVGDNLFFAARGRRVRDSQNMRQDDDYELYVTDGTGWTVLNEVRYHQGALPTELVNYDGTLYFSGVGPDNQTPELPGVQGREWFTSDGSDANTQLLFDLAPGIAGSNPENLTPTATGFYFTAVSVAAGRELYHSDGTLGGTTMIADLNPGSASSDPEILGMLPNGRLLLSAVADPSNDRELYVTGGSIDGIRRVADVNEGMPSSNPSDLIRVGDTTLLVATDGEFGRELRVLVETAPQVDTIQVNDGSGQRSSIGTVTVTFDSVVQVTADAFTVENTTDSESVSLDVRFDEVDRKTVATIQFLQGNSVNAAGFLLDGNYELVIDAFGVSSLGTQLVGNGVGEYVFGDEAADNFFRKYGEFDGLGLISLSDFAAFRGKFGINDGNPGFEIAYDSNGDGRVDLTDFAAFRKNFGT